MKANELNGKIIDALNDASDGKYIFICDLNTRSVRWSTASVDYLGLEKSTFTKEDAIFKRLVYPADLDVWNHECENIFSLKTDHFYCTHRIKNAVGDYVLCTTKGKVIQDSEEKTLLFSGAIYVYDEKTPYDTITNLPLVNDLIKTITTANKLQEEYIAMAIELKHFNTVNTLYGYNFGNKILYELAETFKQMLQNYGTVYRMEGTIFGFYIKGQDIDFAKNLFIKIRELTSHFVVDDCSFNLEIAGGLLTNGQHYVEPYTVISCLYSAVEKSVEEDYYDLVIFDDDKHKDNYQMLELIDAVKNSIMNDCNGFFLCYQPFVSTITGKIIGAEALIRWKNDMYGEVSPYRFIPYLESHPCFYTLGIWIIRQALTDAKEIMKTLPDFFINVNMSYSQLERKGFKEEVVRILEELDFPKNHLQLQLTESCRNLDLKYLKEQLDYFRAHDIKIALDDFGTGSSTINLLCDLPISCVKIDQSFILDILKKDNNQVIVDTTAQCARRLGISVCLEGVENEEIKEFVERYSAAYHQGYYYSRPVVYEKFVEFLNKSWNNNNVMLIKPNTKEGFEVNNILSMMPGGFFIYLDNETEKIICINEEMLNLFECDTREEFLELTNASFKGIVHPDDYERVEQSIYRQIDESDDKMDYVSYRIITKNGKIKHVHDYGHLVHNDVDDDLFYVFINEIKE